MFRRQEINEMTASLRRHNFTLGDETKGYNTGMYETGTYIPYSFFFNTYKFGFTGIWIL